MKFKREYDNIFSNIVTTLYVELVCNSTTCELYFIHKIHKLLSNYSTSISLYSFILSEVHTNISINQSIYQCILKYLLFYTNNSTF